MKNRFIILLSLLLISLFCHAQKVKLKRGTIFIEGTETLSYEKKSHKTEYVIYKLNTKEEIINVVSNIREGYKKIYFVESKKSLETRLTYWNRSFIKWLIEQNVLNLNGTINDEKVDSFIAKYDERITQRN